MDLFPDSLWSSEFATSLDVVVRACRLTEAVANEAAGLSSLAKADLSPVTVGDFAVQALVISRLHAQFPEAGFVAEESADALQKDPVLMRRVAELVGRFGGAGEGLEEKEVGEAIDLGGEHKDGERRKKVFVLDPIDGTRGFVGGRQYCIALGLLDGGEVKMGLLGCPRLPLSFGECEKQQVGCVLYAIQGEGAWMVALDEVEAGGKGMPVRVASEADPSVAVFTESVESGHSSHELSARISSILNVGSPPVRMDSQSKYGCLARGDFTIYMRFPRAGYVENIWDHAAGSIVIQEAGGRVTDGRGRPLNFSKGRKLSNNDGLVATNGLLHDAVIAAVQQAKRETVLSID